MIVEKHTVCYKSACRNAPLKPIGSDGLMLTVVVLQFEAHEFESRCGQELFICTPRSSRPMQMKLTMTYISPNPVLDKGWIEKKYGCRLHLHITVHDSFKLKQKLIKHILFNTQAFVFHVM